ncbi:MAG: ATP-binding protein [bacterium]|nr:ATP-binding protein [bacterium]
MPRPVTRKLLEHLSRLDREQLEHYLERALHNEHLLRTILDTMAEAVIAVNHHGSALFANATVHDLTGVQPDDIIGRPPSDVLRDPALRDALRAADTNAYLSREVTVTYPRRLCLMLQIIPLPLSSPLPHPDQPAYLILLRDVSEQHSSSRDRERESRLETMRLLTAGVAHEIGNPLSALILHTQLMARTLKRLPSTPETRELSRINAVLQEESQRLKRIVGDFLNAVRPLSLQLTLGHLNELLDETFELLYSEIESRKVALIKRYSTLPPTLFDRDQLRGVIINIVRNALDAMPNGGTLTVTARNHGDWIELCFSDDGCGIPPDKFSQLFKPFFTTKPHGSGLGLLMAQRVTHAHGGTIRLQSQPGRGTDVFLELPVRHTVDRRSLPSPSSRPPDEKTCPRH